MPPTAIVTANVKVNEALNEALNEVELKKSAIKARRKYSFLTPEQKYEAAKRTEEYGVTATMCYYRIKYPDMVLNKSNVHRCLPRTYQAKS